MLSSLRKRLLDNSVLVNAPAEPSPPLTHIPWKLQFVEDNTTTTTNGNDTVFPTPSYLNLRHQQNEAWAEERLVQGVAWAKSREWKKAEHEYKQGLEVLPDHANLLTAYGALLANRGYTDQALERLEKALNVDPNHEQAKLYRDTLLRRLSGNQEEQVAVAAKAETSDIAQENSNTKEEAQEEGDEKASAIHIKTSKEEPGTRGYSLVEVNPPSDDSESSWKERKRKRKHKRKRRRKNESDSSTDSESERRRRRRRKKEKKKRRKRKEKKRKRRERVSSEDEESTASQDGQAENTAEEKVTAASDDIDAEKGRQKRSKNSDDESAEEKECIKDAADDNPLTTENERSKVEGSKPDESEGRDRG